MPPKKLIPWLQTRKSLTLKLKNYDADARVVVLSEVWHERLYLRQILMLCHQKPWWYAKTVIPINTFNRRSQILTNLNSDSLGTLLFSDPGISFLTRRSIKSNSTFLNKFASIEVVDPSCTDPLWGRASTFAIDKTTFLYLTEFFLPNMVRAL